MAESKKVAIIGAGGFAREVLDIFDACNEAGDRYDVLGYIVEPGFGSPGVIVNGKPILGGLDWLGKRRDEVFAICAIGAPEVRRRLVVEAMSKGARFCSIIHPTVLMSRWISMGSGVVIGAGCILTNQIRIGDHVQLNLDCTVGHDTTIEDFATVSPGTHISGNVTIRSGCFIGTGVNIINRLEIGEWSVIGAGSTLIRNVPPNSTVMGAYAKALLQREEGWHLKS
jgi:sugar O-acyltransferase (sialic acid O-acetyltransferase NeuD family)